MKTPLSISSKYQNFVFLLGNITTFLFCSLLLPTKSGHSIAIVLALITSALAIPFWKKEKLEPEILSACFFILFLALFWSHTFDSPLSFSTKGDYILRYALGIFFIISFSQLKIRPRALIYGIAVGSIASVFMAFF